MNKVKTRNWSLDKFTKSVNAACKRQGLKTIAAPKVKKAYDDGWPVRAVVALATPATTQAAK
jgi:hypothetical protein